MELRGALERVPLAQPIPGAQQRGHGPRPRRFATRRVVDPGEVGLLPGHRGVVVRGDHLGQLVAAARHPLEPRAHRGVGPCAPRLRHARIGHVADERMAERVLRLAGHAARRPRDDEAAPLERLELRPRLGHRQGAGPEEAADDGRLLHDVLLLGRQAIEARGEERLDRVGEGDARGAARRHPSVPFARDRTLVDEAAQELLDEERVALGAGHDLGAQLGWKLVDPEQPVDELAALRIGQGSEGDGGGVRVGGETGVRLRELGPRREHEQDGALGASRDVRQEGEHLVVRPVEVLDHKERRSQPGEPGGKARPRSRHRLRDLGRRPSVRAALPGTDAGGQRQRLDRLGNICLRQGQWGEDLLYPFAQACGGSLVMVRERGSRGAAQPLGERPERDPLPRGEAPTAEDGHRRAFALRPAR